MARDLPIPQRITADAVVSAVPGRLWAIQLNGGTAASDIKLHNHASSATGTQLIEVAAPAEIATQSGKASIFISYADVGGIPFSVGCYADWTGADAVGYVWFEAGA